MLMMKKHLCVTLACKFKEKAGLTWWPVTPESQRTSQPTQSSLFSIQRGTTGSSLDPFPLKSVNHA